MSKVDLESVGQDRAVGEISLLPVRAIDQTRIRDTLTRLKERHHYLAKYMVW
jgi:hypothetical protein